MIAASMRPALADGVERRMAQDFAGKVAIVTGGASGMGAAAVGLLVERGCKVAIVDLNAERGAALAGETGDGAAFFRCDVGEADEVEAMVKAVTDRFGRLDILFNNAGKGHLELTPDMAIETWRAMIAVNLDSVFYVSKFAIPHIRAAGGGAIVNTASVDGMAADYGMGAYNAAKGGVVNYTRSLALEAAPLNIRVNAVCPGWISDTPMTAHMARNPEISEVWSRSIPMGRGGHAIEVARMMVFLASDDASYVTGAIIPVDGGLTCQTGFPNPRDAMAKR
ncbi:SDR family NAD(P)-dependent oxidoreductase [Sphingomonas bacterium]|uniref:SDR family NAD(P)-dependent oxidoreductase n=1 Tax=Sphingomonas bacterium TaxID=1895847 RepID=UPI001C2DCE20|nr:SDR family NAD(P)-dependent oxidoreductase [Sphingomonas bacterium]